jgi:hypothetical protein
VASTWSTRPVRGSRTRTRHRSSPQEATASRPSAAATSSVENVGPRRSSGARRRTRAVGHRAAGATPPVRRVPVRPVPSHIRRRRMDVERDRRSRPRSQPAATAIMQATSTCRRRRDRRRRPDAKDLAQGATWPPRPRERRPARQPELSSSSSGSSIPGAGAGGSPPVDREVDPTPPRQAAGHSPDGPTTKCARPRHDGRTCLDGPPAGTGGGRRARSGVWRDALRCHLSGSPGPRAVVRWATPSGPRVPTEPTRYGREAGAIPAQSRYGDRPPGRKSGRRPAVAARAFERKVRRTVRSTA